MFETKVQAQFIDRKPPTSGHYLNKFTKERLKKRKLEEETCSRDSATLTYNILYIPRILKTDLRRQYPVMFMNVYNSCNYEYMKGFMDKFFREDTQFIFEAETHRLPIRAVSNGRENFGKAWFDRMNDAPDLCFELTSVQIRLRSDGTSTCSASFKYYGTTILYVDPNQVPVILSYCEEAEGGLLILPKDIPLPSLDDRNTTPSPLSTPSHTPRHASSSFHSRNPYEGNPLGDDEGIKVLKDYRNRWNDIQVLSDLKKFQDLFNKLSVKKENNPSQIPWEEGEYLYKVFKNEMSLIRQYPRVKSQTAILPLGIPFQFIGNFTFHLDEESRVITNDLCTHLMPSNCEMKK